MNYYIAIDHGGTKTRAVVFNEHGLIEFSCDDALLLKSGIRNNYNWHERIDCLKKSIDLFMDKKGAKCSYLMISLNGVNSIADIKKAEQVLQAKIKTKQFKVVSDIFAALRGCELYGVENTPSIVLCAGSGLNCAISKGGKKVKALGWRIGVQDQGGYAIGRKIWDASVDDYNGFGKSTILLQLLLSYYKRKSFGRLIDDISKGIIRFAPEEFALLLFEAVMLNDIKANEIMNETVERWLRYICLLVNESNLNSLDSINLYLSGGLFNERSGLLKRALLQKAQNLYNNFRIRDALLPPIGGAALLLLDKKYNKIIPPSIADVFLHSFMSQEIR